MKPPSALRIGPYRYSVKADASVQKRVEHEDGHGLYGLHRPHELTIYVDPTPAEDMVRETLLHEVLHAILLAYRMGRDEEENLVAFLSPALLDCLRRNPKLAEYLLS